ncbi:uncharacterized protein LOC110819857 [Carica papaya]|uniref:uncharacterized protein LOC110819857 n=1 Tax=Carica papaya TaxID=3649 RepID=UPI000B8CB1C8|nr:uncharacterized protein LOC110819857 [Carica papaya]
MGQAFRRAAGRIRGPGGVEQTPPLKSKTAVDRTPVAEPTGPVRITRVSKPNVDPADGDSRLNAENVLEERDPQYDAMLTQMLGRVRTKPGGKAEMGEAFVVEKQNRPMPKLRNTKPDSWRFEERPAPPGTLNVVQLRHIMLLYQGKADDHNGPMDVHQIAEKFRIDEAQVQRIVQFLSLPPEDSAKQDKLQ